MKLNELNIKDARDIIKSSKGRFTIPGHLIDILSSKGYNYIGGGAYTSTFKKQDSNYVIKINRSYDELGIEFLKYAQRNWRKNPNLPKIIKIHEYNNYFIIFTEALTECDFDAHEFVLAIYNIMLLESIASPSKFQIHELEIMKSALEGSPEVYKEQYKNIRKILTDVHLMAGSSLDLKKDNIMMRGHIIIINDPIGL